MVNDERPQRVGQLGRRRRARAEDRARSFGAERGVGPMQAREQRPERAGRQLLDEQRAMRLGEEAAVEQAHRREPEAAARVRLPREQLLRDGVAVVVREHVRPRDAERARAGRVTRSA